MTVSTSTSKQSYTGNGVTTLFAFTPPFLASSDLQVYVGGVLKTLTTDYTVSGTAPYPSGANITFLVAPGNGVSVVIARVVPYTQTLHLVANDPMPADAVEQRLDANVMMVGQLLEQLNRALVIPITDTTGLTVTLPAAATRANQAIIFDSVGNVTVGAIAQAPVSPAMQPVVAATTLALARVALGIGSNLTTASAITAAATTDLGTMVGQHGTLNGNTGITSFGNSASLASPIYVLEVAGTPLITNSANIILPGGVNYQAAAGDILFARFEGASVWRVFPMPASGKALINPTSLSGVTIDNSVIGGTTPAAASFTSINGGQLAGFRNKIINGNFRRWDYGTTYALTTSVAYGSANRWASLMGSSAAGIFNQDTSITAGLGFKYNAKVGRNNGSALTNNIAIYQAMESLDSIPLAGQQVTLSYYAKKGANFSSASNLLQAILNTGTGTDQSVSSMNSAGWTGQVQNVVSDTLTTSWQRFQHTFTIPAGATQIGTQIYYTPVGTAGADDNFYITGIQLEPGPVATPFEDRGECIEQLLCARFLPALFVTTAATQGLGTGQCYSTTNARIIVPFRAAARVVPTGITASAAANFGVTNSAAAVVAATAIGFVSCSQFAGFIDITVAAGLVGGNATLFESNAAAISLLFTGAEL